MSFIFDTGSAWTWIPNEDCPKTECKNGVYHFRKSKGYLETGQTSEVVYGIGYIQGMIVNDDISISKDAMLAAKDVNFLSVYHARDLSGIIADGLLGLSPKVKSWRKDGAEVHLLVDQLKADGVISKAMFALYLTEYTSQSRMQFGGYDQTIIEQSLREAGKDSEKISDTPDGIYWMDINSDVHWQVRLSQLKFGNDQLAISVYDVILDSGSSLNYLPTREYN